MKVWGHSIAIIIICSPPLYAQISEGLSFHKHEEDKKKSINTISFQLPEVKLNALHNAKGEKLSLRVPEILVNEDTLKAKDIHVRGNTSSYFRRKSLNVKTSTKAFFYTGLDTFSVTKFYAISMNMDRNYVRNKIALAVLRLQKIQTPSNGYANLVINGHSEGLYLIFYPPNEFAMKELNAPLVIRRGYGETIDKIYVDGGNKLNKKELKRKFKTFYAGSTLNKSGRELYQELSNVLDLDNYFSWLAFNHLFQNGDYTDEVYFVWNITKSRYQIIPWDFDDILRSEPHEGAKARGQEAPFIFSLEDKLDKKIANDPYLYEEYLKVYSAFLEKLTPENFKSILIEVYNEVYPYYLHDDIISQSQFDQNGETNIHNLETDLKDIDQVIGSKIIGLRNELKAILR